MDSPDATVALALGASPWQVDLGSSLQPTRCVTCVSMVTGTGGVGKPSAELCTAASAVNGRSRGSSSFQGQSKSPNAALHHRTQVTETCVLYSANQHTTTPVHLQKHIRSVKGACVLHKGYKK